MEGRACLPRAHNVCRLGVGQTANCCNCRAGVRTLLGPLCSSLGSENPIKGPRVFPSEGKGVESDTSIFRYVSLGGAKVYAVICHRILFFSVNFTDILLNY